MTKFTEHEIAFLNATIFHVERDWKGRKGLFAKESGISGGYLSEIIGRKKCPKLDKQDNIAKAAGYKTLQEYISFGMKLSNADFSAIMPKFQFKPISTTEPVVENNSSVHNLQKEVEKQYQIIIKGFQNKEVSTKINKILIQMEKIKPNKLEEVLEDMEHELKNLKRKYGQEGKMPKKIGISDN